MASPIVVNSYGLAQARDAYVALYKSALPPDVSSKVAGHVRRGVTSSDLGLSARPWDTVMRELRLQLGVVSECIMCEECYEEDEFCGRRHCDGDHCIHCCDCNPFSYRYHE